MATASSVSSPSMERIMSLPHSSMRLRHSNAPSLLHLSPQAAPSSFSSSLRPPSELIARISLGVDRHKVFALSKKFKTRLSSPGFRHHIDSKRFPIFKIRASSEEEENSESLARIRKVFSNVKDKWDELEKKPTVFLYGGSAVLGLWFSSILIDALDSIPMLPKFLELVGFGYFGWFVYTYLLFKSGRDELGSNIQALKKKITGEE
ncbi:protein CURVATURE THYLAKOID 1A, chloroplastic-like isoform X1 [Nicotiana tomentosiformis]|uniref:protein CURVATURE THYLAKOID 1A, chloroplastic-like isoform X1 n=1 Tax=Nicotiana tomentosiformis TaxID=4098 RepID=UPI00388CEA71